MSSFSPTDSQAVATLLEKSDMFSMLQPLSQFAAGERTPTSEGSKAKACIAEKEKENGNIEFKNKNYQQAKEKWLLSLKNCKIDKDKKILFANLALVNIYLGNYSASILYCQQGLKIVIDDNKLLDRKLQYRKRLAETEIKIDTNSEKILSEKITSSIDQDVLELFRKKGYIHVPINSYFVSVHDSRFIGVLNVLTCISIFITSPERTFVCHLPVSNLLHIKSTQRILKYKLKNHNWTKAIIVGGHRETDIFAEKMSFSESVISLIKNVLPGIVIDASKLNNFNGQKMLTEQDEINLRKKNTRFVLAVYDCIQRKLITHTDFKTEDRIFGYLREIVEFEVLQYQNTDLSHGEKIVEKYYKLSSL